MSVTNLSTTYYNGRTPLFYSLFLEKNDLLYKLILAGANINRQDKMDYFASRGSEVQLASDSFAAKKWC